MHTTQAFRSQARRLLHRRSPIFITTTRIGMSIMLTRPTAAPPWTLFQLVIRSTSRDQLVQSWIYGSPLPTAARVRALPVHIHGRIVQGGRFVLDPVAIIIHHYGVYWGFGCPGYSVLAGFSLDMREVRTLHVPICWTCAVHTIVRIGRPRTRLEQHV